MLVGLGGDFNSGAVTGGPIICLACTLLGQTLAAWLASKGFLSKEKTSFSESSTKKYEENSTVVEIQSAIQHGANVLDLRGADQKEADSSGVFVVFEPSVN